MWWLLCQAVSLQLKQPWEDLDVYAHVAAADGLKTGLEESARRREVETSHLEELVASLHTELEAAELEHANRASNVSVPPPDLGPAVTNDAAALARELAEGRVRTILHDALNTSVDASLETVRALARAAGEHVAKAAAGAAATHAAETAADHLVEVACELFARPSADALYAGAQNATMQGGATHEAAHEAGTLASASADKVLEACVADSQKRVKAAREAAMDAAQADAQKSAAKAADDAVEEVAPPAAREAGREQLAALMPRAVTGVRGAATDAVTAAFVARTPTKAEFASSDEQVKKMADELFLIGEAAEKIVKGAEKVALDAALKSAAPDLPERIAAAAAAKRPEVSAAIAAATAASAASAGLPPASPA